MPDIHHAIQVAASTQTVTDLVATGAGLQQWWAEDVETAAEGRISLGFFNRATVYRLRLLERGPDAMSWRCETGEGVLRGKVGCVTASAFRHGHGTAADPGVGRI